MKKTAKALYDFWSSFGINAFPADQLPDDLNSTPIELPYLTHQIIKPEWRYRVSTYAKVYFHDTSYADITDIIDSIESRIGEGVMLPTGDGFLLLFKDINFCQFQPTGDPAVKMAYLMLVIEANTK